MLFDILALLDSESQSKFMCIYYHNRKEMSRVSAFLTVRLAKRVVEKT